MVEQCVRCGPDATEFHINIIPDANPFSSLELISAFPSSIAIPNTATNNRSQNINIVPNGNNSELFKIQRDLHSAKQQGRRAINSLKNIAKNDDKFGRNAAVRLKQINPMFRKWVGEDSGLNLRSIFPESHQIFSEFEKNRALENSRPRMWEELEKLKGLAESQRKFSAQTRKWLNQKSPLMGPDFEKGRYSRSFTKNLNPILDEPLERKEVICLTCGMVVRTFIEIEGKLQYIFERLQDTRILCEFLDKYDSAMVNWERDDKIAKEKAKKIRKEKKLQAELETLEAQRRSAEEKLRKLQDE